MAAAGEKQRDKGLQAIVELITQALFHLGDAAAKLRIKIDSPIPWFDLNEAAGTAWLAICDFRRKCLPDAIRILGPTLSAKGPIDRAPAITAVEGAAEALKLIADALEKGIPTHEGVCPANSVEAAAEAVRVLRQAGEAMLAYKVALGQPAPPATP